MALAIHAFVQEGGPPLDADFDSKLSDDVWTFRVHVTRLDDGSSSNLVAWISVNKHTAALTDPMRDDEPIEIPRIAAEQAALRARHCYNSN